MVIVELEMERHPVDRKPSLLVKVAYWEAEMFHMETAQMAVWPDLANKNIGRQLNLNFRYT